MKRLLSFVALAAVLAPAGVPIRVRAQERGDVQLNASEVLLDLVVTDKKGHPIVDLKRDEVEVLENGERQDVTSFGLVRVGPQQKSASESAAPVADEPLALARSPFNGVNLILIVVDRTSVTQQNLAQVYKAAEAFVNDRLAVNDLVAVFVTTSRPLLLQNFTSNKTRLLNAMKIATTGTSVALQEAVTNANREALAEAQSNELTMARDVKNTNDELADERRNKLLASNAAGIDTTFANLRDQIQTLTLINSILALTKVYANVTGRKSVVLYSEGFVVNDETEAPFEAMIGAANRANFSINTVSAGGLLARAPTGAVLPRRGQPIEESDDRMLVSGGESGMDRLLKPNFTDNDEALARLAKETGGVLVRNTNDLGKGFQAIENDLRNYYLLSYSPTNTALDGSFRSIEVKVTRKDAEVRARKGYYAVPGGSTVLLPYEQPVLAMLTATSNRPSDLKVAMKTERFVHEGGWKVPVVLSVDGSALQPTQPKQKDDHKDDAAQTFETDAVVLIRDGEGQIVAKLSRATFFQAPKERLAEFRSSMLSLTHFAQQPVLAPGTYTLEIGVYDPNAKRGTVIERKISLPALPSATEPSLSSLVLARQAVAIADADAGENDPLVVGGKTRIVPCASGQFVKSRGDRLIAYFQLHAQPSTTYNMVLHFMIGEEVVIGTPPAALPPTDAQGVVSASPPIPLDGFKPGNYRAVLYIVPPGSNQPVAMATTPFTVEP